MHGHTNTHTNTDSQVKRIKFASEPTPDFSSKILIPPKETVRNTFCLCSPLDRAAAAIPWGCTHTDTQKHNPYNHVRSSIEMHMQLPTTVNKGNNYVFKKSAMSFIYWHQLIIFKLFVAGFSFILIQQTTFYYIVHQGTMQSFYKTTRDDVKGDRYQLLVYWECQKCYDSFYLIIKSCFA